MLDKDNVSFEAMQTSVSSDSGRAKQILGWEPKRYGFVSETEVYANAFVAGQEK